MKKKLFALLMAGVMAFALIGCGNSGAPTTAGESSAKPAEASSTQNTSEPKKATVAVIFKALTAEYWKTMKEGCDAAAIAQQVTMIEEQLSVGVDAIAVAPCEENAVIGALSPYLGKLPIIAVDTDFNLEGKTAFIGTGNTPAAKLGGEFAAKAIGKGGNAVLIGGQQGEGTSAARLEGFTQGLEENGCTVLETQYGKNTADGAIAVMEDLLTKYPGKINAVLAMNDDMIQGCLQAIKNAGISGITLVGFNGDSAVLHLIDSGEIDATVAQQPYSMGYQCVAQAYKAIQGEKIEEYQDVPALLITKENVVSFLK